MNQYSEQVLSAIDTLVDNKLSKLRYDKTIEVEITLIADIDSGEYKVKYQGNTFSAFANNVETQYKIGEKVYVVVPEGDFSNKKIISAKISKQSLSQTQLTNLQNQIIETSPNLVSLYNNGVIKIDEAGIVAGPEPQKEDKHDKWQKVLFSNDEAQKNDAFTQYARNFDLIKIEAQFQTLFTETHSKGNYGLLVEFYTIDSETIATYKLDIKDFNGQPYHFNNYTLQSNVIQIEKNYLTGIKQITLFQEGFDVDSGNTEEPNIFVKDVKITFVERKDLSNVSYYLTIQAPNGNVISDPTDTVNLKAYLAHQGKELSLDKAVCTWYERDLSIMVGTPQYAAAAGFGWRQLKGNDQEITLTKNDVAYEKKYKLVVVYNDDIVVTTETEVWNLISNYNYSIEQDTNSSDIKLLLKNNSGYGDLQGIWYISYLDGGYAQFSDNKKTNEVTLEKEVFVYPSATIYCSVYDGESLIGTEEYNIQIGNLEQDLVVHFEGLNAFRYDANGDIAIEEADQEKFITPVLTWKDGLGDWYNIAWIAPDGERLDQNTFTSDKRYQPKQSMMQDLWVDTYNILHYNIKRKFRAGYLNNTVKLEITTLDGSKYLFDHEVLFVKDGDQGTNGSSFVIQIAPYDLETGNKDSGYQGLFYDTTTNRWKNPRVGRSNTYSMRSKARASVMPDEEGEQVPEIPAILTVEIAPNPDQVVLFLNDSNKKEYQIEDIIVTTVDGSKVHDKSLVSFSSSDITIATVNDEGLVTAVGKGKAKISAVAKNGIGDFAKDFIDVIVENLQSDTILSDGEICSIDYIKETASIDEKTSGVGQINLPENPNLNQPEIEETQNAKIQLNSIIVDKNNNLKCQFKDIYRPYKCYIYKDGEELSITLDKGKCVGKVGNKTYEIEFEWEAINLAIAEIKDAAKDYIAVTGKTVSNKYDSKYDHDYDAEEFFAPKLEEDALPYYIKVTATIKDGDNVNILTNLYPIDVYCSSDMEIDEEAISYIFDLPNSIMYSTSGVTPTFKNYSINTSDKYFNEFKALTPEILNIEPDDNNEWRLVPTQSYKYNGSMGIINAVLKEQPQKEWIQHTIVMYLNTYGNEAINGWDGISVKINDDKEDGYILAPQVGAGEKVNGRFTGVVMGEDTAQKQIGLYGYQEGINTFGFKADGTGYIGPSSGGRIEFNGEKGIIKSGSYSTTKGMAIDLKSGQIQAHDLILKSANMTLDSVNQSFVFDLQITGNKETNPSKFRICGKKDTGEGIILFNISEGAYYLQSANFKKGTDGTYINLQTGYIEANKAILRGTIQANNGNIGGWQIGFNGLYSSNNLVNLESNGTIRLGNGQFIADKDGNLSIGGGAFEVDNSGNLIAGNGRFRVNNKGDITANSLAIYSFNQNQNNQFNQSSWYGTIGEVQGKDEDGNITSNLGIQSQNRKSIVFESDYVGRFTAKNSLFFDARGDNANKYGGNVVFRCKNILWSDDINSITLVENGKIYAVFG